LDKIKLMWFRSKLTQFSIL